MNRIIYVILCSFSFLNCLSQTYKPDYYGYIADKQFYKEIKSRNYKLVSSFDTLDKEIPIIYAIVIKEDSLKWLDLDLVEHKFEYNYYNYSEIGFNDYLNEIGELNGDAFWQLPYSNIKVELDTFPTIIFDKKKVVYPKNCNRNFLNYACNKNFGIIDTNGNIILRANYRVSTISSIKKKYNFLALQDSNAKKMKIFNMAQRKISDKEYNHVLFCHSNSLFIAQNRTNELKNYLLIDTNFNELTSEEYISYADFSNQGFLALENKSSILKYTIFNSKGELIDSNVNSFEPLSNRYFLEMRKNNDTHPYLLNLTNYTKVAFLKYDKIKYLPLFQIVKTYTLSNGRTFQGLSDTNGNIVLEARYDNIDGINSNSYLLKNGIEYSLFNRVSNNISKINYTIFSPADKINHLTVVQNNEKLFGAINEYNKLIFPFRKDTIYKIYKYLYTRNGVVDQNGNMIYSYEFKIKNCKHTYFRNSTMNGIFEKDENLLIDRYNNEYRIDEKIKCKY